MPKTLGDYLPNTSTSFNSSQRFYEQKPVKTFTLQNLRDDEEFNDVSERFLTSLGEGETPDDLFNYFRGADFNLGDAFSVYRQSKNFTDQQKQDYAYLRNRFDNANIGGLWERTKVGGDIAQEIISDPVTLLSALFIPFTGGASGAARLAAGKAVQSGLKKLANKEIAEGFAKGVAKLPGQKLKQPLSKKQTATILGAEGFLYGGTDDFVRQSTEVQTGQRDNINIGQTASMAAITGLGAAGLYGAGVGISKVPAFRKSLQDRRLDRIDNNENYKADLVDTGSILLDKTTDILSKPLAFLQKPTSKFINRMKDSETLTNLIKTFRYDADKRFIVKELGTQERLEYSFSEELDDLIGKFQERLVEILNPLKTAGKIEKPVAGSRDAFFKIPFTQRGKTKKTRLSRTFLGFGKKFRLDPEINDDLFYFLNTEKTFKIVNGQKINLDKQVLQAGNKIRKLLDDIQSQAAKEGAGIGKLEKYFPRKWMAAELQEELNSPGVLTKEIMDKEGLSEIQVQELLVDMIQNRNFAKASIMDLGINTTRTPGLAKARTLKNIDDTKLEKYLDTDVESVISDYLHQASGLIARKKYFGINVTEFQERFINKINDELGPKNKLTNAEIENLINIYKVTTGQIDPIQNKYLRGLADGYTVLNQMALLPLATITSLSEIGVPLLRGAGKKAFQKGKGEAELGKGGIRILWDTTKEFAKEFHNTLVKTDVDVRSGSMKELNRFNRAMGQAAEDRALAMFGEGYGIRSTAAQNKFFKYNLLHQWTRFVQLTSYEVGKSKIYENLYRLANNQVKGSRKLRLQDELNELGINIDEGIKWIKDGANPYGNYYKNNFTKSAARYVDEVIMNPKAAANQKPLWHSYSGTRWAFGLLGFPTAFNNTVIKNAIREVTRDARGLKSGQLPTSTASIVAGITTMTTAAMLGNTIRTGGRNLEEIDEGKKDLEDLVFEATKRAGLLGPYEYAYRIEQNRKYQTLPESVIKNLSGPAVADIIDLASGEYGRGALSLAVKKIPGVTALSSINPQAYKDLQKWARENDITRPTSRKITEEDIQPKQRPMFAKGGIVEGEDNVPFTKEDPADRINPYTGEPYQEQMSRLGFDKGGKVSKINENKINVYHYLKEKNLRPEAIIGIMANIDKETDGTYDYQMEQYNGKGYGLFQLDPGGDHVNQYNMFLERNNTQDSMESQLDYFLESIYDTKSPALKSNGGTNARELRKLFSSGNIEDITKAITEKWERPDDYLKREENPTAYEKNLKDRIGRAKKLSSDTLEIDESFDFISTQDIRYLPTNVKRGLSNFKQTNGKIYLPKEEANSLKVEIAAEKMSEDALRNDPQGRGFHGGDPEYDPRVVTGDPAEIKGRQGIDEYGTRPNIYRATNPKSPLFFDKYVNNPKNLGQFDTDIPAIRGAYMGNTDELLLSSTKDKSMKKTTEPHEYMHRGLKDKNLTTDEEHEYIDEVFNNIEMENFNKQLERMTPEQRITAKKYLESQRDKLNN